MAGQNYSITEVWNRILRSFKGETLNELPDTLDGEIFSGNQAASDFAELLNSSLPSSTLALPTAVKTAITTAGFASGTASSLVIVTGTSTTILTGATKFVFGAGFLIGVTGTSVYITKL